MKGAVRQMQRNAIVGLVGMTALLFCASAALALEGEDPTDIIAAQIRAQGYATCDCGMIARAVQKAQNAVAQMLVHR